MKKEFKKGKFSIKRVIAISLSCAVVIPVILVFADAERLPTEFFEVEDWNEETKGYVWFAHEMTDYDILCSYLTDESFVGYNYESWYGNYAKEYSEMVKEAIWTFPAPNNASSARLLSYNSFSRDAFIPIIVAVTYDLSSNFCEGNSHIIGNGSDYRVIKFSGLGYSDSPISEGDLTTEEINYARIKYLYQLIITNCYDYEKVWGSKIDLNYCSIPLMRAVEALWDKSALSVELTNSVGLSQKTFEKKASKINVDEIQSKLDSGFDMSQLQTKFPHAYAVFRSAYNGGIDEYTPYAICPSKANYKEHQIVDTGSFYHIGIPGKEKYDDEDEESKDETQMDTKEE